MTQNENVVNTLPKGLYIPRPIALALFNLRASDVGKVVRNMVRLAENKMVASRDVDSLSPEGLVAFLIWKEMFNAYARRRNG